MKNIHVLHTNKPSRLISSGNNSDLILLKEHISFRVFERSTKQIYITSDEEIKDGEWCLLNNRLVVRYFKPPVESKSFKKIILTTDKDLIKDGVQEIDDEFLEWFVKNPSCEEVEVEVKYNCEEIGNCAFDSYKIIIPKEKPKKIFDLPIVTNLGSALTETMKSVSQHEGGIKQGEINLPNFKEEVCTCTDECLGYLTKSCKRIEEPKQETLEEFIQRQLSLGKYQDQESAIKYSILAGAKWQQEQDKNKYSEEDLKQFAFECVANFLSNRENKVEIELVNVISDRNNELFEQFKKK